MPNIQQDMDDEEWDLAFDEHMRELEQEDRNATTMRYGHCPKCKGISITEHKSNARDVDDLDVWSEHEIEKMDQGWNPIQDFGATYECRNCGYVAHESAMDVSY